MELKIFQEIIKNKNKKIEFSVITNLETGNSKIFLVVEPIDEYFFKYEKKIQFFCRNKINGIK